MAIFIELDFSSPHDTPEPMAASPSKPADIRAKSEKWDTQAQPGLDQEYTAGKNAKEDAGLAVKRLRQAAAQPSRAYGR